MKLQTLFLAGVLVQLASQPHQLNVALVSRSSQRPDWMRLGAPSGTRHVRPAGHSWRKKDELDHAQKGHRG